MRATAPWSNNCAVVAVTNKPFNIVYLVHVSLNCFSLFENIPAPISVWAEFMSLMVEQEIVLRLYCDHYGRPLVSGLHCGQTGARDNSTRARESERDHRATGLSPSPQTKQRGWNAGHLQSSITGKGPVFPPRLPPRYMKTRWRTKHRRIRVNSPKTHSRRSGCRVKMAFPKNTFLKERVRMTAWPQPLASVCTAYVFTSGVIVPYINRGFI